MAGSGNDNVLSLSFKVIPNPRMHLSVRVTKRPQGYVCGSELTNIRYAGCTIHGGKEMGSKLLTLL